MLRYWQYIEQWIQSHVEKGYYIAFSDNCPPGIAAVRLYRKTHDLRYLDVANKILYYLYDVASRTSDGGLNHMGWVTVDQLWVDSLFMFGVFLAEMGSSTGDGQYFDFLTTQMKIFASHLRDTGTGLFLHMWDDTNQTTTPKDAIYWARGNGWVFVTLVELLSRLPSTHPDRVEMESYLTTMAESLAETEDPSGLWHTVLNVPDTYLETSATALFCYGFAKGVRMGLLAPAYQSIVNHAKEGLLGRLYKDCSGSLIVSGTSYGTSPGTLEDYQKVTVGDQVPYGVGAVMLAASETDLVVSIDSVARETGCPPWPPSPPDSAETFVHEGIRHLGSADLEGAEDDFHQANLLDQGLGSALFGDALVDVIFLGLDIFDTVTKYTISELSWPGVQTHIRTQILPGLENVHTRLRQASADPDFYIQIPELKINRRGLYTPIRHLTFDHASLTSLEILLSVVETLLRVLA
jgi:unsaturated rhamnogalacturonyl hydrolase